MYFSDKDECLANPCGSNAKCVNVEGSPGKQCPCLTGYTLISSSGGSESCVGKYVCLTHR